MHEVPVNRGAAFSQGITAAILRGKIINEHARIAFVMSNACSLYVHSIAPGKADRQLPDPCMHATPSFLNTINFSSSDLHCN